MKITSKLFIDRTGLRLGKLTVIKPVGKGPKGNIIWLCNCDCGKKIETYKLTKVKSCRCLSGEKLVSWAEKNGHPSFKHGQAGINRTATYRSWASMLVRCRNKSNWNYKYYGGRGITVCKKWLKFENFYHDMGDRPKKTTLDRINPDGNYEKENCRWADSITQRNNRSDEKQK